MYLAVMIDFRVQVKRSNELRWQIEKHVMQLQAINAARGLEFSQMELALEWRVKQAAAGKSCYSLPPGVPSV